MSPGVRQCDGGADGARDRDRSHIPDDLVSSSDTPVTRPPVRPYDRVHEATGGPHEAAGSRPVPRRRHALSRRLSGTAQLPLSPDPLRLTTRGPRAATHTPFAYPRN